MSTETGIYLAKIAYLVEDFKDNIKRLVGIRVANENFEVEDLSLLDYIKYSDYDNSDFWNIGVEYYILKLDDLDKLMCGITKSLYSIKKDVIKLGYTRKDANVIVGVGKHTINILQCGISVMEDEVELIEPTQPVAIAEWGKEYSSKVYYNVFYIGCSFVFYPDGFNLDYYRVDN